MTRSVEPPLTRRERRQQERRDRPIRERGRATARRKPARPAWQSPMVLITAAALVVGAIVVVWSFRPAPSPGDALTSPPIAYSEQITDGESMGSPDAPVVMEVVSDFQCPFCARFVREQFVDLKARFVDTGILRIDTRDIALVGGGEFDESLEMAVGAVCAARQDRYWQFHDLLFWNQGRENRGDHNAEFIARVADRAGVDRGQWDDCVAGTEVRSEVLATTSATLGEGITGTPQVILNGTRLEGGVPNASALIAQIEALAAAASPAASSAASGEASPTPVP